MTTEEQNKKTESKLLIDSSVLGCEGIRGSGKTLFATYLTLHAQEVLGAKVFHNGALSFGEYIPVEDLISLGDRLRLYFLMRFKPYKTAIEHLAQ